MRIEKEMQKEDEELQKQREAEHIDVVIEEESERARRIYEDRVIEERAFHVEHLPYEAIPYLTPQEIPAK